MIIKYLTVSLDHEITIERCGFCGHYYGTEQGGDSSCPTCAGEALRRRDVLVRNLRNANAALRGVITKLKGRK